jgi:ABC-type phosphate/phosphonate transport system substrate-binding protein
MWSVMKRALILAVALTALAGCGASGGSKNGDKYPQAAIDNFNKQCVASGGGTNDVKDRCNCVIGKLQDRVKYKDFQAADTAIKNKKQPTKATLDEIDKAVSDCRKEG